MHLYHYSLYLVTPEMPSIVVSRYLGVDRLDSLHRKSIKQHLRYWNSTSDNSKPRKDTAAGEHEVVSSLITSSVQSRWRRPFDSCAGSLADPGAQAAASGRRGALLLRHTGMSGGGSTRLARHGAVRRGGGGRSGPARSIPLSSAAALQRGSAAAEVGARGGHGGLLVAR